MNKEGRPVDGTLYLPSSNNATSTVTDNDQQQDNDDSEMKCILIILFCFVLVCAFLAWIRWLAFRQRRQQLQASSTAAATRHQNELKNHSSILTLPLYTEIAAPIHEFEEIELMIPPPAYSLDQN